MPDHEADYPDMMESAYILFDGQGSGEFAFGCVPAIWGAEGSDAVELSWDDNDEMDEVNGDGWAELQPDGSLHGEISFHRGDGASFVAKPWATSSTAC